MILSFPQGGPWMESLTENVNPNSFAPQTATIDSSPGVQPSTRKVHRLQLRNTPSPFLWWCWLVCQSVESRVGKHILIPVLLVFNP